MGHIRQTCAWDDFECAPLLPGCGTQHPHRALGGTRILLAAAPTTPPCFRHWRRSSSLQRNYYLKFRVCRALRSAPNAFSQVGSWREMAGAALLSAKAQRGGGALPVCTLIRRYAPPSPDWGKASAAEVQFPPKTQSLRACPLPLGGAVAQRLRGYKSAEPEKTVKRSSRRTGVNLQFFPV